MASLSSTLLMSPCKKKTRKKNVTKWKWKPQKTLVRKLVHHVFLTGALLLRVRILGFGYGTLDLGTDPLLWIHKFSQGAVVSRSWRRKETHAKDIPHMELKQKHKPSDQKRFPSHWASQKWRRNTNKDPLVRKEPKLSGQKRLPSL